MNTITYPTKQIIVSEQGIFNLHIIQNKDRNTGNVVSYSIHLGGKERKCFNMKFPSHTNTDTSGYLSWIESHEECSFETFTNKGISQHIISLGISIARTINPNLTILKLEDNSNFPCKLPNGIERKVPMKPFHLAFHQATWYEYYFDAKLEKNYEEYLELKKNFRNPSCKPEQFDFMNDELQHELMPIYSQTNTWEDFFTTIAKTYGRNKCAVLYPWIQKALYMIFENHSYFENVNWYIDLKENMRKNKTASVYFESYMPRLVGGKTTHRHTKKRSRHTWEQSYLMIHVPETMGWKYSSFLHSHRRSK